MKYFLINGQQSPLPDLNHLAPFKAVLAVEEQPNITFQNTLAQWLVESGCRYVMLCGEHSEGWEKIIRQVNLELFDIDDMDPKDFVMITPHTREKLRQVFWHAKKHAHHPSTKFHETVTIHLASRNRSVEYLAMYEKA